MIGELIAKKRTSSSMLITCKTFKSARLIFSLLKKSPAEVVMDEFKRLVLNADFENLSNEFDNNEVRD